MAESATVGVRELLADRDRLRAEKRRLLDGGDTWSTRKVNRVVLELEEVEVQLRDFAVAEYEVFLDIEDHLRATLGAWHGKSRDLLARLDAVRSGA